MSLVPLIAVLLLLAPAASAEVFRWTDDQGRMHFTQSLDQVPAKHRQAARDGAKKSSKERNPIQTYAAPAHAPASGASPGGVIRVPFERQGHLMRAKAVLNDHLTVPFLIDTGASGVALPASVVSRLGIPILPNTPRIFVSTANGIVRLPIVEIQAVQLGGARVENLVATVNPSLDIGLLGGAFFNNFVYGVDAAAGVITLTANDAIKNGLDEKQWRLRFRQMREPIDRLDTYLRERELTDESRRRELTTKLAELREDLMELEREAKLAGVPAAWRH